MSPVRPTLAAPALAALLLAGCLSSGKQPAPDLPDLYPVGNFSLTERTGRTVTRDDLLGKVWVASFVFTRCTGPCPQVTGTVARLQSELGDRDDVRLVTFTVDPDRDNPGELRQYADHFGADRDRWLFLTGPREEVYKLLREGFRVGVERNDARDVRPGQEVTHSTRLALVDRKGHVRAYFDGRQVDDEGRPVDDVPKVKEAVEALLREAP